MKRNIFTDISLARDIVSRLDVTKDKRIIDLGCGDGVFLEAAVEHLLTRHGCEASASLEDVATRVTGIEIDPESVQRTIDKFNRKFSEPSRGWDVRCEDALRFDHEGKYDLVIGNPPWVGYRDLDDDIKSFARSEFEVAEGPFNLYQLFIERGVKLLKTDGQLALVVPQLLQIGPASSLVREFLFTYGHWTITPLPESSFVPKAGIKPALLLFTKGTTLRLDQPSCPLPSDTLGEFANISSCVPSGADSIFIVDRETEEEWDIEAHRLKPIIRGRDVARGEHTPQRKIVWPYRLEASQRWQLDDLTDSPNTLRYLTAHRNRLQSRPRFAGYMERNPSQWYRLIDPNRHIPNQELRIVIPSIFRQPAFEIITNSDTVIHNSCFQLTPRDGQKATLMKLIRMAEFWTLLMKNSRKLESDYCQTSVSELRKLQLTALSDLL